MKKFLKKWDVDKLEGRREVSSFNKELIREIASELGIEEQKVPQVVERVKDYLRYELSRDEWLKRMMVKEIARDEKLRQELLARSDLHIGRRALIAGMLGGALGLGALAGSVAGDVGYYVRKNGSLVLPAYHMPYSAIVFKENSKVVAENWKGELVAQGVADTDDASVIQSAVDSLTADRTWKEKVLLIGKFELTDSILVPSYTILDLRQSELFAKEGLNKKMIVNKDAEYTGNVEIDIIGGYIHGNKTNQTFGEGIHLKNASYCRVVGTEVFQAKAEGILLTSSHHIELVDVFSLQNGITGIVAEIGSHHINIVGGIFKDNEYYGIGIEHFGEYSHHINIVSAIIESNSKNGVLIDRGRQVVVSDCQIADNGEAGIAGDGVIDCIFAINIVQGNTLCGINLYLDQATEGYNNLIVGNTCVNNGEHGIRIDGVLKNRIMLNLCKNNSQKTVGVYSGIMLESSSHNQLVYANECIDDQGSPTQSWGINAYWPNNLVVYLNKVEGNVSGQISVGGGTNQKVKYNIGYTTENSGTATFSGDGSTTQFTIAHGLVSTPSNVQVTPKSADAAGDFYVTVDSNNIYINYKSAPPSGSNNIVLDWYAEV